MASSGIIHVPTPDEILRVGVVAAAGFYHSPANAYERPKRDMYPQDTIASYQNGVSDYLWNKNCALLIIEDGYNEQEDVKLYPALQEIYGGVDRPKCGNKDKIIVGLMCVRFKPGPSRIGRFQSESDEPQFDFINRERDQSLEGINKLSEFTELPIQKHLDGMFTVDMIAVHPAYWRRGNGSSLLAWATKLADEDKIPVRVASVPMGVKNAQKAAFEEREVVDVDGYPEHPEPFKIWIGVREPRDLSTSVEDAPDSGR